MMLAISIFLVLSSLDLSLEQEPQTCECWDGYRVELTKNGPQCTGINLLHVMPCNLPKMPKCQCSGSNSSILKDRTGTWCTRYRRGEEVTRWPCENAQEWKIFFQKHPHFI